MNAMHPFVDTVAQEFRYAVRTLRKSPAFTSAAVATLALAIGANTVMFSVVNSVLLRPLPYQAPEQLAMLWTEIPGSLREGRSAYWNIEQWRSQSHSFSDMAVFDGISATLTRAEQADRVQVARVSPNFFSLLGVQPAHGRTFTVEEAEQRERLAIISHRFWQSYFGGSREAIGASVDLDGKRSRIIGILPPDFAFARMPADVWEPYTLFPDWDVRRAMRGVDTWFVVGRLRAHTTAEQAQNEMDAIARRLDEMLPPDDRNRGISVVPLSHVVTGTRSRMALWMLTAAVFCVLLIAAANVASLSLARSASRGREMSIRAALGASPGRIMRQLLAESLTLAAVSGILGAAMAWAGVRLIRSARPVDLARLDEVSIDWRVLAVALAFSLFTGILVGLAPALVLWRKNLTPSAEGGRVSGGVATNRLRRVLVVAEFALAMVLLFGAGLLIRSWWNVESVDPGFRTDRVLAMELRTPLFLPAAQRASFFQRVLDQVASVPGVESAGFTSDLFISSHPERAITPEGGAAERLQFRRDEVSVGFFETIGTRLLHGRYFSAADGPQSPRVVIINDAMARRLWGSGDPVGKRLKFGAADSDGPWFVVAGVVANMRRQGLERESIPQSFEPITQNPSGGGSLLIRTSTGDPMKLAGSVQAAVRQAEKHAPLYGATTLEDRLDTYLMPRRFQTALVIGFSAVALLMAAIGIYGLIQYSIATRTQEIGIRMAVGARSTDIFRMILGEGLRLGLTGLLTGLIGAVWAGQLGQKFLFGVSALDPLTLAAVSAVLIAVAGCACYFPARRAMKVEPTAALRQS